MEAIEYLIIGGGLAGAYASINIRKHDTNGRVLIITNENDIPYDRVPLSKEYLKGTLTKDKILIKTKEFYEQNTIELLLGAEVTNLDAKNHVVTLKDGKTFAFKKLLLATGGHARKLTIPGSDLNGVYYLRTIEDCDRLKDVIANSKRAVVVGGGFIGCELASALTNKGLETTIIEMGPYLLNMALDEETGTWISDYFSNKGVKVITNASAAEILGKDGHVIAVKTKDGQEIETDFVIIGVGLVLNVELAEKAGLKVEKGILVNQFLETSIENIYAAGDVARFFSPIFQRHLRLEHYDIAVKHGNTAGINMSGDKVQFNELPYFFSYQFDLKIHAYGDLS